MIILGYFTAQKDTTVAHLSLLFLVFPVVYCQMLAPPDPPFSFPSFCVIPLLFFCLSLGNSTETLHISRFFFADTTPEAHEWTPAKIVSMNIDSRIEQGGY